MRPPDQLDEVPVSLVMPFCLPGGSREVWWLRRAWAPGARGRGRPQRHEEDGPWRQFSPMSPQGHGGSLQPHVALVEQPSLVSLHRTTQATVCVRISSELALLAAVDSWLRRDSRKHPRAAPECARRLVGRPWFPRPSFRAVPVCLRAPHRYNSTDNSAPLLSPSGLPAALGSYNRVMYG
jgi:hypothetical protein